MKGCAAIRRFWPKAALVAFLSVQVQRLIRHRCSTFPQAQAFSQCPATRTQQTSVVGSVHLLSALHATNSNTQIVGNSSSKGKKVPNTQVRTIMGILEDRYDLPETNGSRVVVDPNQSSKNKTMEWKKTRNYLYHVSRSYRDRHDDDGQSPTLSEQVVDVLDFLDERLELPPRVSKQIVQESPRILRKPVDSFLIPTADFLLELWGRELFVQAVERNPALLLTSGVGYTTNRKTKSATTAPKQRHDKTTSAQSEGQRVEEILEKITGLSSGTMERMKRSTPFVFGLEPAKVHSVLDFLHSILYVKKETTTTDPIEATTKVAEKRNEEELKVQRILGKVISAHPNLLNLSVESNLQPRVEFLTASCELGPAELARVVQTSNGSVLGLSVENNLKPTMDYLLKVLFHNDEDSDIHSARRLLKKCILAHPQLLGLSLPNLQSKVDYFGTWGPSLACRIATKCPAIYSLNLDQNIVPSIDFLGKVWGRNQGSISLNEFVAMLQEYPNVITLSVETNLQPTMMFFNKTGYTILDENWDLVPPNATSRQAASEVGNTNDTNAVSSRIRGRHIAASLYNRLLPRWHYCLSITNETNGLEKSEVTTATVDGDSPLAAQALSISPPLPITPPLHLLIMASDEVFCESMGFKLDAFAKFKKDAIPRLKFSSQFDTWLKTGKPIDL